MTALGGMGARDIRMLLRGKVDPDVGKVLVSLADRQDHLYQLMAQMAEMMNIMADGQLATTNAVGVLRDQNEALKAAKRAGVNVASELDRHQSGEE